MRRAAACERKYGSPQVDPGDPVPGLAVHLEDRQAPVDGRVVDEHVHAPEPLDGRSDELLRGVLVGEVDRDACRLDPGPSRGGSTNPSTGAGSRSVTRTRAPAAPRPAANHRPARPPRLSRSLPGPRASTSFARGEGTDGIGVERPADPPAHDLPLTR